MWGIEYHSVILDLLQLVMFTSEERKADCERPPGEGVFVIVRGSATEPPENRKANHIARMDDTANQLTGSCFHGFGAAANRHM